jgi:hypothetical protein
VKTNTGLCLKMPKRRRRAAGSVPCIAGYATWSGIELFRGVSDANKPGRQDMAVINLVQGTV